MFELFTMGTNCVVFGVRRVQNMIQQIQLLRGVLPGVQYQQKVTFFFFHHLVHFWAKKFMRAWKLCSFKTYC